MNITQEEQSELLKSFPNVNIELSYENVVHKKVHDVDYVMTIPNGQKCFAWFTHVKNQNVCIVMEITDKKQILSMKIVQCCFKSELCYGTVFYGTTFMKGVIFFSVEDILYYKGNNCSKKSFLEKLETLEIIFKREIRQVSYSRSHMVFGLPPIILKKASVNPPLVKVTEKQEPKATIKPREFAPQKNGKNNNEVRSSKVFTVKADIQNDIYHLYVDENGRSEYFDVAYIPDYKTSVYMNSLFRKIKENKNLDSLEESDDEEEFENDQIDKFVHLDRSYKMNCIFHPKFKKWVPIDLSNPPLRKVEPKSSLK